MAEQKGGWRSREMKVREDAQSFDRFSKLAAALVSVPKDEIGKRAKAWERSKKRRHKPPKDS